ncbi:MAG TPA: hypothetical protein DIT25_04305 [Candidatus Moranbacteria bacterium]|nr:hypothetical protein [Candidatus Moranbacteria bacterium]
MGKSKKIPVVFIILFFAVNFASGNYFAAAEDDISDIKDEMKEVQKKVQKTQEELNRAQILLNQNKVQLTVTQTLIIKTENEIVKKEDELKNLNSRIELSKKLLSEYIKEMYLESQEDPLIRLAMNNGAKSMTANADHILGIKEKILSVLEDINFAKKEITEAKESLAEKKDNHSKLMNIKLMEQREIKEDIQDAQTTLNQLNDKLNQLRSEYSRILGKSVSTKDILKAADFAAKATGMSKSFLLGVLIQESNKGQNVGGCTYPGIEKDGYARGLLSDSKSASSAVKTRTATFKKRKELFEGITKKLGYDSKKQPVSCNPKSYAGTGGAMGIPQYMSDTWIGYEKRIASLTGNNPPDPWNLLDGVSAMAIKLAQDGASQKTRFAEAKSYCVYLAGGNWGSYCFGTDKYKKSYQDVNCWGASIKNYGEKVLCLKDNYEKYY